MEEGRNPRRESIDDVHRWIFQAVARKCAEKSRGRSGRRREQGVRACGSHAQTRSKQGVVGTRSRRATWPDSGNVHGLGEHVGERGWWAGIRRVHQGV